MLTKKYVFTQQLEVYKPSKDLYIYRITVTKE